MAEMVRGFERRPRGGTSCRVRGRRPKPFTLADAHQNRWRASGDRRVSTPSPFARVPGVVTPPVSPVSLRGPFFLLWPPLPRFRTKQANSLPAPTDQHDKSPTARVSAGCLAASRPPNNRWGQTFRYLRSFVINSDGRVDFQMRPFNSAVAPVGGRPDLLRFGALSDAAPRYMSGPGCGRGSRQPERPLTGRPCRRARRALPVGLTSQIGARENLPSLPSAPPWIPQAQPRRSTISSTPPRRSASARTSRWSRSASGPPTRRCASAGCSTSIRGAGARIGRS